MTLTVDFNNFLKLEIKVTYIYLIKLIIGFIKFVIGGAAVLLITPQLIFSILSFLKVLKRV